MLESLSVLTPPTVTYIKELIHTKAFCDMFNTEDLWMLLTLNFFFRSLIPLYKKNKQKKTLLFQGIDILTRNLDIDTTGGRGLVCI